jgi:hypothetical protein
MSVTNVHKDTEALTMTVTAEYDVAVERAWQLWNDPRQLERWWGPPTYPATVVEHDGTIMTIHTAFPSLEAMHRLIDMGMEEGLRAAMGQIDGLLARPAV